jgi:hypothetical protein
MGDTRSVRAVIDEALTLARAARTGTAAIVGPLLNTHWHLPTQHREPESCAAGGKENEAPPRNRAAATHTTESLSEKASEYARIAREKRRAQQLQPSPSRATAATAPHRPGVLVLKAVKKERTEARAARQRAVPYIVKGGRVQPTDPDPCSKHGRTTRVCIDCASVRCWKCLSEATPSYLRVDVCTRCASTKEWEDAKWHAEPTPAARALLTEGVAYQNELNSSGGNRVITTNGIAGRIDAIQRWGAAHGWQVLGPTMEASLLCVFIKHRSTGHASACKRGAVAVGTIKEDLTAVRAWQEAHASAMRVRVVDHTYDPTVTKALKKAKDEGPPGTGKKAALSEEQYALAYNASKLAALAGHKMIRHEPEDDGFRAATYFIATAGIWNWLPRRSVFAASPWEKEWLDRDWVHPTSQAAIGDIENRLHWSLDEKSVGSCRFIAGGLPGVAVEKNRGQQAKSTRFATSAHYLGLDFPEDLWNVMARCGYGEMANGGPLLRRSRSSKTPWNSTDWCRYLDWLAVVTDVPRGKLGTTSLRRGCATSMRERGVAPPYIKLIGYWNSDANEDYDGAARTQRLEALKPGGGDGAAYGGFSGRGAIPMGPPAVLVQHGGRAEERRPPDRQRMGGAVVQICDRDPERKQQPTAASWLAAWRNSRK